MRCDALAGSHCDSTSQCYHAVASLGGRTLLRPLAWAAPLLALQLALPPTAQSCAGSNPRPQYALHPARDIDIRFGQFRATPAGLVVSYAASSAHLCLVPLRPSALDRDTAPQLLICVTQMCPKNCPNFAAPVEANN